MAGRRKRVYPDPPTCATLVSACGRVSGTRKPTLLACVVPPTVRTNARLLHGHRLCTWAERVLKLAPAGGAKSGSTCATWRACLEPLPACTALITRLRGEAAGLRACQKMLNTPGLSHDTLAQCTPLLDAMPSPAFRLEVNASLVFELVTAKTRGLDHVGVPISSDAMASLCGVAKPPGVGETQDAARIALRLPYAVCPLGRKPSRCLTSAWRGHKRLQVRSSP